MARHARQDAIEKFYTRQDDIENQKVNRRKRRWKGRWLERGLKAPPHAVADAVRTWRTFTDAVRAWRVDQSKGPSIRSVMRREAAEAATSLHPWAVLQKPERVREILDRRVARFPAERREIRHLRKEFGDRLLKFLREEEDLSQTELFLAEEVARIKKKIGGSPLPDNPSPSAYLAREIVEYLSPVLSFFVDPRRFFRQDVWRYSEFRGTVRLQKVLPVWGFAALLNPAVRKAFEAAEPDVWVRAVALAEGRTTYLEGSSSEKQKGKHKSGRPPKADEDLRPGSQEKRILRSGMHKR